MASSRRLPLAYNISILGEDGSGEDYEATAGGDILAALDAWEAATDNDLVTATMGEVLLIKNRAGDTPYILSDVFVAQGATTNSSYFRVIRPYPGDEPNIQLTTGTRVSMASMSPTQSRAFRMREDYFQMQDIGAMGVATHNISAFSVFVSGDQDLVRVIGCICSVTCSGSADVNAFACSNAILVNCGAYDADDGFRMVNESGTAAGGYILNCTAENCGVSYYCISTGARTYYAKNCISQNAGSQDFQASTDAVWDQTTNTIDDVTFEDAANNDYHLDSTDTGAIGNGTDLSADGTYAFDDDIDYGTRAGWDIGADEQGETGLPPIVRISDVLKTRESDVSGAAIDYLIVNRNDGSVVANDTSAANGTFVELVPVGIEHDVLQIDSSGTYNPVVIGERVLGG